MASFFSRHAGETLKKRLAEIAGAEQERLALNEEVDIARLMALESMQMWEAAQKSDNSATRGQAVALVRQSIDHITETVKRAATVRQLVGDSMSAEDVGYVVAQVQKILDAELGSTDAGREVLKRVTKQLEEVRLPAVEAPPLVITIQ